MNTLITICARAGSKRLPGKNVKLFNGKPLMEWTIIQAKRILSEDLGGDFDIAVFSNIFFDKWMLKYHSKDCVPSIPYCYRPDELNGDDVPKLKVIRYGVDKSEKFFDKKYDIVIDLDVTAPCRLPEDIKNAYRQFLEHKPPTLFSAVPARRTPNFNQILQNRIGRLYTSLLNRPFGFFYDMNASIYIYDREWLNDEQIVHPVYSDSQIYVMQDWQAFDIDTPTDWEICEYLFRKHILEAHDW